MFLMLFEYVIATKTNMIFFCNTFFYKIIKKTIRLQKNQDITISNRHGNFSFQTLYRLIYSPSPCFQSSEGTLMESSPFPASGSTALTAAV